MAVSRQQRSLVLWSGLLLSLTGCAAARPLSGIPAASLPDEFRAPNRSAKRMIDLSLLRQTPADMHRVDSGDVLGIYVEGFLGGRQQAPPVNFRQNPNSSSSIGYPIRVRADGTISLPGRKPLPVRGMSIVELEDAIRRLYTTGDKPPIKPGFERVLVTLQRPRHYRILVIRQEAGNSTDVAGAIGRAGAITNNGNGKRGTGRVVNLPAYRNDVLNALAETGGLPGLDAENVIYVIRRRPSPVYIPAGQEGMLRGTPTPKPVPTPQPATPPAPAAPLLEPMGVRNFEPVSTTPQNRFDHLVIRSQSPGDGFDRAGGHSAPRMPSLGESRVDRTNSARPGSKPVLRTNSAPIRRITGVTTHRPPAAPRSGDVPLLGVAGSEAQRMAMRSQYRAFPLVRPGHPRRITPPRTATNPPATQRIAAPTVRSVSLNSVRPSPAAEFQMALGAPARQREIVRIPLRVFPGEPPTFSESDVILEDGDVVLIESRDADVFYTGGLLGGGRFQLPRDQDLDVLQALALVQAERVTVLPTRAVGGISAMNQDVTASASDLIVLRQLPGGGQMRIRVDLYDAVRNPRERIHVRPGDHLILRYKRKEAIAAFFERHILDGAVLGVSSGLFFNN